MGIGVSVFLMAVGAILAFAVDAELGGVDLDTIGIILMVVGVIGLIASMVIFGGANRGDTTVIRDREIV